MDRGDEGEAVGFGKCALKRCQVSGSYNHAEILLINESNDLR